MSPVWLANPDPTADKKLSLSPLMSVRWSGGHLLIFTPSHRVISAFDARILTVLQAFATPKTPTELSTELRELPQSFLAICLAMLKEHGVLIEADRPRDLAGSGAEEPDQDAVSAAASIATVIRAIARDARALGPYLEMRRTSDHPFALASRLEQVRDVLIGLASELQRARPRYLEQQLLALDLSPFGEELKLHLGCGSSRLAGWLNIDYPPADLVMDLGWDLPFQDGSITYAYLAHVLEHFDYPIEALALVKELHRVLAPGGVLRVVVPDIRKCILAYAASDASFFSRRADLWPDQSERDTPLEHFLHYAGVGVRPHAFWGHKFGYDFETLSPLLARGGFAQTKLSQYMQSEHAALRVDCASRAAGYRHGEDHYSLFVEATK
jgi:predicted SAM-dependent methyltransferase